jgi:adenine-specific DNA-methyltransferase
LPDVVIAQVRIRRLILVDIFDFRGQLTVSRCNHLAECLAGSLWEIIMLNAFQSRDDLDWTTGLPARTTAWFAEEPDHLVHFGGHALIGPSKDDGRISLN